MLFFSSTPGGVTGVIWTSVIFQIKAMDDVYHLVHITHFHFLFWGGGLDQVYIKASEYIVSVAHRIPCN